jgi:integrase
MSKTAKAKTEKKTRSARGTGRLYKRTKDGQEYPPDNKTPGVFWIQYTANGKRARHALTGKDGMPITELRDAEAERKRLTAPMRAGNREAQIKAVAATLTQAGEETALATEAAAPVLRIADAWEAYLQSPDRPQRSGERTRLDCSGYWTRFNDWLTDTAQNVFDLWQITPQIAQDYAADLKQAELSPNSFNKHTGFLKRLFDVLNDQERPRRNPFANAQNENRFRLEQNTNSRRELTLAELKDLLENATGDLQTLLYIGTFTGLRLGDCCTLKWGEVDLDRGLIRRIPNKTAKKKKPVLIGIPTALHAKLSETPPEQRKGYLLPHFAELYIYKNEKGYATRRPDITKQIQKHFKDRKIETHRDGTGFFEDENGKPVSTGTRAVLEVGFHSLRHTYVSLHAAAGTPQAMIQANVGHASPAMTAHYTHVNEDTARQVAGVLTLNEPDQPARFVPPWIKELAKGMTAKNWKAIKAELTGGAE